MYRLTCNIQIINQTGQTITYNYVGDVNIMSSLKNLTDICTLKVPRKLKYEQKDITHYIKRNNEITIKLGYDNQLETVFKGYIKTVSTGMPIIIQCENEAWKLKQTKIPAKHYESVTLQQLIDEYFGAYETKLADMNLGELRITEDVSLAGLLSYLSKNFPVRFYFRDNIFYAGLPTGLLAYDQKIIKFEKGINFQKDNLNYTLAEDYKLQIVAKAILKDNTKIEHKEPADAGDAEIRTFYVPGAETKNDLKVFASEKLKEFKIDKMTGSFPALGKPYVRKGDIVHLFDDRSPERNDKKFLAESVNYKFNQSGYKQIITLGQQIH